MTEFIAVGIGGMIGAVCRFGLSRLVQQAFGGSFPLGTLSVNVLGCLLAGVLTGLMEERQWLSPSVRLFLVIGVLGSLTTFSAFGVETIHLMRAKQMGLAFGNCAANLILGIGAVMLGWFSVRLLS